MTWTAVVTDTFSRANSGPDSTPGNTDGVGNGWIDVAGGTGSIVSDQLNVLATAQQAGSTLILRPVGEATGGPGTGQRVVVQFIPSKNNPVLARYGIVLQCNGTLGLGLDGYFFQATSGGGTGITAGPVINGVTANPSGGGGSGSYSGIVSGDTYQFDAWVYQNTVGPVFLQSQLINLTTSATLSTTGAGYDATAGVPASGQQGIPSWEQTSGTTGICVYTSAITYTGSPPSATMLYLYGPTTGTLAAPSTFSIVPSGQAVATVVITPASTDVADTFSPTTATISLGSSTPVNFVFTPNTTSGSRTISITNNATFSNLNTVVLSAGSSSISLNPSSAYGNTPSQTITVTGVGTDFTGTPFSLSGSFAFNLQTQTILSTTSATIVLDPGVYGNGNVTVTDSADSVTATLTVVAPVNGSRNVGYLGDSITLSNTNTGVNGYISGVANSLLNTLGYTTAHTTNQGINGASTYTWLPAQGFLGPALAAMTSAGMVNGDFVHIMLGTNDARPSTAEGPGGHRGVIEPADHFANMTVIVDTIVAYGFKVILSKPIWTWPYANGAAEPLEEWVWNCNQLYGEYYALDITLCDNTNVFIGDAGAGYEYAQQNPTTFLQDTGSAPGIHPANETQYAILGDIWATAIANYLPVSGSGPSPPTPGTPTISVAAYGGGLQPFDGSGISGNQPQS